MRYQLSYEATYWERGQLVVFISPVRSEMMCSVYETNHIATADVDESALVGKSTAMIILYFHLLPQYQCDLFHVYYTTFHSSREI